MIEFAHKRNYLEQLFFGVRIPADSAGNRMAFGHRAA